MMSRMLEEQILLRATNAKGDVATVENRVVILGNIAYHTYGHQMGKLPDVYAQEDVYHFEDPELTVPGVDDSRMLLIRGERGGIDKIAFYSQLGDRTTLAKIYEATALAHVPPQRENEEE